MASADLIGYTNATAEISSGMDVCQRCRESGGGLLRGSYLRGINAVLRPSRDLIISFAEQRLALRPEKIKALSVRSGELPVLWYAQIEKIYLGAAAEKLKMKMRAGGVTRLADVADHLTGIDSLAFAQLGGETREVRVA
jgi:hypothetical protein